jgi:RNA polymerase sigma-70 factor (ECF subfamily)
MKKYAGQLTDKELLSEIRRGDDNTLKIIFQMYHSPLCSTVFRMVQDREVAKDIVQEVFIRFWHKHNSLPQELDLKAYLYKSAINGALNYLKKTKRIQQDSLEGIEEIEEPQQIESSMQLDDLQQSLNYTIEGLPPVCKTVFMLSRFDEMPNRQIADYLQISLKSVEKHITKALKTLRSTLGRQHE